MGQELPEMCSDSLIHFGAFELQLGTGELRKRGRTIKLPPQAFRLLALLASRPGRLVTREAIREELWGSNTFVDFEHGLNFCVRQIRNALGESAKKPRFIETLPRRGYRFVSERSTGGHARTEEPHEQYAKGREKLYGMGKGMLDEACEHFERALALDPQYAMAHSGLGAARAMRFVHRSDPDDLVQARRHLKSARELDGELAEPYPWLCYIYMRDGKLPEALAAGQRAIQLLPEFVQAHYFLGLVYFLLCETDPHNYQNAANHLLQAVRTEPRWQASWFVLSFLSLLNGNYERAEEFANRLLDLSAGGAGMTQFVGGEALLGTVWLRRGHLREASQWFTQSLRALSLSDHMYRDGIRAFSACGLGDTHLREGKLDLALADYRQAWQIVQECPGMLAQDRHSVRALAGLAAVYAAQGDSEHGKQLLSQALQKLEKARRPQSSAAGADLAELYYATAVTHVRTGNPNDALDALKRAIHAGYLDSGWLQRDSELRPLFGLARFSELLQQIDHFPKIELRL